MLVLKSGFMIGPQKYREAKRIYQCPFFYWISNEYILYYVVLVLCSILFQTKKGWPLCTILPRIKKDISALFHATQCSKSFPFFFFTFQFLTLLIFLHILEDPLGHLQHGG